MKLVLFSILVVVLFSVTQNSSAMDSSSLSAEIERLNQVIQEMREKIAQSNDEINRLRLNLDDLKEAGDFEAYIQLKQDIQRMREERKAMIDGLGQLREKKLALRIARQQLLDGETLTVPLEDLVFEENSDSVVNSEMASFQPVEGRHLQYFSTEVNPLTDLGRDSGRACFRMKAYTNTAVSEYSNLACINLLPKNTVRLRWSHESPDIKGFRIFVGESRANANQLVLDKLIGKLSLEEATLAPADESADDSDGNLTEQLIDPLVQPLDNIHGTPQP